MSEVKGCPSCAAYAATWLTDCNNPIHMAQANAYIRDLEQRLASLAPAWSQERPTVPGFYWCRDNLHLAVVNFTQDKIDSSFFQGNEWAGPIVPPEGAR